jgi:hypothetical protein
MSGHKISEESKNLLSSIRMHNETIPRLKIVPTPVEQRARLSERAKRAYGKTKASLHNEGLVTTTKKIAKKIKSKSVNKIKNVKVFSDDSRYKRVTNSIRNDGLVKTSNKVTRKIRSKLLERR